MIVISATIDYNGSTIATVTNETKVLTTGGKWVTGNIKITDVNEAPNVTQDQEGYVILDDGGTPQTIVNPLSITSNGTYSASSGYAFNPVVVDVDGGISIDDIAMRTISGNIGGSAIIVSDYAFFGNHDLTSVNFPNCTSIGSSAFAYCESLENIDFPSCTSIGYSAFMCCSKLISANFPLCSRIGTSAFYSCKSLANISFPICTSIGTSAFTGCKCITIASFPECTSIGYDAFGQCISLESAYFPLITSFSAYAFFGCWKLSDISFPMCTSVASSAFQQCYALKSVDFSLCTYIGFGAFAMGGITASMDLSFARFPAASYIGSQAFNNCSKLKTVIISHSFSTAGNIYSSAFCSTALLSLYMFANYNLQNSNVFYRVLNTFSIYVPESLYESYIVSANWSLYSQKFVSLTESEVSYVMEHGTHVMS